MDYDIANNSIKAKRNTKRTGKGSEGLEISQVSISRRSGF